MRRRLHVMAAALCCVLVGAAALPAQAPADANRAFDDEAHRLEVGLAQQHATITGFLPLSQDARSELGTGQYLLEDLNPAPAAQPANALLHHWRGTVFVRGATAQGVNHLLRDFARYPTVFAPDVLSAHADPQGPDRYQITMRVQQQYVIRVVLDSRYDVTFGRAPIGDGDSTSRSTRIDEIGAAGTPQERTLTAAEANGFLWRQNSYWSWQQRDDGVYIRLESLSLSRGVPAGIGWLVSPFVQSVPRESLRFTLSAVARALQPAAAGAVQTPGGR